MAEIQNPYIAGSPLSGTEMFFGREDIFEFIRQTLAREHGDHVIVLYGQRRTGKTSVLKQLHRHLDARYLCVFIDLHLLELNGLNGFLWQLARNIRRELEREHGVALPALDRETFMADPRDSFRGLFLDQVWAAIGDRQLVLMIDEAVRLQEEISAGKLERDVFDYLRHLMQHYPQLQFLFSLGSGLEEMEREYAFLFSVGLYKKISFLERPVAETLITEPVRGCYELEPAAVARIYQTTSGHPYYTQLLCHSLFNRWHEHPKDRLAEADVDGVLEEVTERGSAALKNVWDDSTLGERVVMAGLAAAIGDEARPVSQVDLARFWREHGLEIASGEVVRAIRSLFGRDILVGEACPSFTVEMQRRWIEKWCRPDWIRQEVADAQTAEAAKGGAGEPGPIARGFRLIEPTPPAPEPVPSPSPAVPPLPEKTGLWGLPTGEFKLSLARLLGLLMFAVFVTSFIFTIRQGNPSAPAPQPLPPTLTVAPVAKNDSQGPAPAQAGGPTTEPGPPSGALGAGPRSIVPPPVLTSDSLDAEIRAAANRYNVPYLALLALAQAESERRSDKVEPATLDEALKLWPAVYAGWARQRVARTYLGLMISTNDRRPERTQLEGAINVLKNASLAGDVAAIALRDILLVPDPTHTQILDALLRYGAENMEKKVEELSTEDVRRYQDALIWAVGQVQAATPPSPVVAVITPTPVVVNTQTPVVVTQVVQGTPVAPASVTAVAADPTLRFDPNTPAVFQSEGWDAAPAVTTWMLRSVGRDVTLQQVTDELIKRRVVNPDLGLLDMSGAGIAAALREVWDVPAFHRRSVSYNDIRGWAGTYPVVVGGGRWAHWTGIRGADEQRLFLANPAPNWRGVGQELDRDEWAAWGPFSAVVIQIDGQPAP